MIYYKGRQIDEINAYNVEGTTLNNQSKEIEINKNGETIITYDEGYTGLEQVTVNVNVASQGGEGGNIFETIGYTSTPQYIQDGIEYAKTIQDNWDASITYRRNAFSGDTQLIYFPQVDTSNVTDMGSMFYGCGNLQYIQELDMQKVTYIASMFRDCKALKSFNFKNLDTSKINSVEYMFYGASVDVIDFSDWDNTVFKKSYHTFYNCTANTINLSNWLFKGGNSSSDMANMFYNCKAKNIILNNVNTTQMTSMNNMFYGCGNLTSFDLSSFDTSNITNMGSMFYNCIKLTDVNLSSFNTSAVTNMNNMFYYCQSLTSLDLSSFDTSNVTDMRYMFNNCSGLTSIEFGDNFDTSKVTNMSSMFQYCSGLTSLDLSSWNTSNVTTMSSIFNNCYKLQRIDGYLDWTKISSYPSSFITSSSSNGYPLRYMTIKNLGKTGTTFNFNNSYLQNWGDESNTTTYPLSVGARQSLVDSLLTYSYDRAANGLSNCKIQLHSKVKARLTADEITAIQNKGYTIS